VGPIAQFLFGTNVSFSALDTEKVNLLAGLTAVHRWDYRFPLRAQVSALTDLTISNRQIWLFTAGVQVGWNLKKMPKVFTAGLSRSERESGEQSISFNSDVIFFEVNSDKIRPGSRAKLLEFGQFLQENHDLWTTLEVLGHTDNTGPYEYNLELSERRAATVRQVLLEGGQLPASDIKSLGMSFSQPRMLGATEEARKQNRRVELKFSSTKSLEAIRKKLKQLRLDDALP
jgi:outer membrane protein OmpA-like peptidoglycan-associated protein